MADDTQSKNFLLKSEGEKSVGEKQRRVAPPKKREEQAAPKSERATEKEDGKPSNNFLFKESRQPDEEEVQKEKRRVEALRNPEKSAVRETPSKGSPESRSPAQASPAPRTPEEATPAAESPLVRTPEEATPAAESPLVRTPEEATPAAESPLVRTPEETTPAAESPLVRTPEEATPAAESPLVRTPEEATPAAESPLVRTIEEATPAAESPQVRAPEEVTPTAEPPPEQTQPSATAWDDESSLSNGSLEESASSIGESAFDRMSEADDSMFTESLSDDDESLSPYEAIMAEPSEDSLHGKGADSSTRAAATSISQTATPQHGSPTRVLTPVPLQPPTDAELVAKENKLNQEREEMIRTQKELAEKAALLQEKKDRLDDLYRGVNWWVEETFEETMKTHEEIYGDKRTWAETVEPQPFLSIYLSGGDPFDAMPPETSQYLTSFLMEGHAKYL
ncbi:MAG: hypothetical protein KVP17_002742 [Porospora cf. gigantea B]|nr:MAG: hypothetical protein KVP17_002742 [Porospora cf. gigantea B]